MPPRLPVTSVRHGLNVLSTAPRIATSQQCRADSVAPYPRAPRARLTDIISENVTQPLRSLQDEAALQRAAEISAQEKARVTGLERLQGRKWKTGDVYAPHDLSSAEAQKWKLRKRIDFDLVDMLALNPTRDYTNFTIVSEFMSETGRIKHPSETGLRPKNQRKVAKMVRRAIGQGLMPSTHKHPLLLDARARQLLAQSNLFRSRMPLM